MFNWISHIWSTPVQVHPAVQPAVQVQPEVHVQPPHPQMVSIETQIDTFDGEDADGDDYPYEMNDTPEDEIYDMSTETPLVPSYPMRYEGFVVANMLAKKRVIEFLASTPKLTPYECDMSGASCADLSFDQVKDALKNLYQMPDMWQALDADHHNDQVTQWVADIKKCVVRLIGDQLNMVEQVCGAINRSDVIRNEILMTFMIYPRLFEGRVLGHRFLKATTERLIYFCNGGMISSFLVFAQSHPDLICDEIHLYVDHTTDVYAKEAGIIADHPIYGPVYQMYKQFI